MNNNLLQPKQEVDFVFLLPGLNYSGEFLTCWTQTIAWLLENNYTFIFRNNYHPTLSEVRNSLVGYYPTFIPTSMSIYPFSNQLKFKKVIFIDSDILWSLDDLKKLLNTNYDIYCGVYASTDRPKSSVSLDGKTFMTIDEVNKHTEPFEVYATGFGFVSCSFEVLNAMKYPWFKSTNTDDPLRGTRTEDIYFCEKARVLNYKTIVDPSIKLGHQKLQALGHF